MAEHVYVDSSGFDGNLGPGDDTVQELAQKVDDLVVSAGTSIPATQTITSTQHNGNSGTPAPSANYAINSDLVTENANSLWQLYANFTINVHNQQTLGSSTYKYELATAATGGTVLASHTTASLAGGANENFTLTSRIAVGTTTLYIRGSRTAGNGIGLVQIGGSIYVLAEVSADKVDIVSSGFNGVLRSGDNTAQKAFQRIDDYVTPAAHIISWTPVKSSSTGSVGTITGTAFRIDRTIILTGQIYYSLQETSKTGHITLNVPVRHTSLRRFGVLSFDSESAADTSVTGVVDIVSTDLRFRFFKNNTRAFTGNVTFMIVYTTP